MLAPRDNPAATAERLTPAEEVGPPVGRRGWATQHAPSPPSGFPFAAEATATDDALLAVTETHKHDGTGTCEVCGEEWICGPRLRAVAELRRRGVERPIREGP